MLILDFLGVPDTLTDCDSRADIFLFLTDELVAGLEDTGTGLPIGEVQIDD